jgi:hypothetical protein
MTSAVILRDLCLREFCCGWIDHEAFGVGNGVLQDSKQAAVAAAKVENSVMRLQVWEKICALKLMPVMAGILLNPEEVFTAGFARVILTDFARHLNSRQS